MNEINGWLEIITSSLKAFGEQFMGALPSILGALLVLIFGWILARFVKYLVGKTLKIIRFDTILEKTGIHAYLEKANINASPAKMVGKLFYWLVLLFVLITAADILGWSSFSNEISKLIAYIPGLMIGVVFFIAGIYIARILRDIIAGATQGMGIKSGKVIAGFVYYFLFVLVLLTALQQAGIDTSIISSNLLIIIGTVLIAAAISYGLASREILSNILSNYYTRNLYKVNMVIEVDGIKGTIVSNSSIGITLKINDKEKITIPAKELVQKTVKIFEQE